MRRLPYALLLVTGPGWMAACSDEKQETEDQLACLGVYHAWTQVQLDRAARAGSCEEDTEAICSRDLAADANDCAHACYAELGASTDALIECGLACVKDGPKLDPSDPCLDCYVRSGVCARRNCSNECLVDIGSAVCLACLGDAGCTQDFTECSGLPDPSERP